MKWQHRVSAGPSIYVSGQYRVKYDDGVWCVLFRGIQLDPTYPTVDAAMTAAETHDRRLAEGGRL